MIVNVIKNQTKNKYPLQANLRQAKFGMGFVFNFVYQQCCSAKLRNTVPGAHNARRDLTNRYFKSKASLKSELYHKIFRSKLQCYYLSMGRFRLSDCSPCRRRRAHGDVFSKIINENKLKCITIDLRIKTMINFK